MMMGALSLCACLARADESAAPKVGTLIGILDGQPAGARLTVTAVKRDGTAVRAALSGADGVYTFPDLPAGEWTLTLETGGRSSVASTTVLGGEATRLDLTLAATAPAAVTTAAAPAPTSLSATLRQSVSDGLTAPAATEGVDNFTPFAFGDFTWLNGSPRNKAPAFDTKFFTPDIRLDVHFLQDFNRPKDHTIVGSTEEFRSGEFQLEQISVGGDFHWENVRARLLAMYGMFAETTPRNDASSAVGQWNLSDAYRYVSEANLGYHFDVNHGLNVDAGIFVSYIGLFSYYNYDDWTYQPSFVSSNTPWFFNGLRVQWFPTNTLKIEPWIINGWQSYARINGHLGFGGQVLYQPTENLKLVFNNYGVGQDNLGLPHTTRYHTDDSVEYRYFNEAGAAGISKAAFSITADAGCQSGGGLHCTGGPNQSAFLGVMAYHRLWFHDDLFAVTVGGGYMTNPGRYLTLLPPINGATAASGTPYFTENPGQSARQWDATFNLQYMPRPWITWWSELGYRHSNVPYFAGEGGVTPPGGNNGAPQDYSCNSGASAGSADLATAQGACASQGGVWYPDLRTRQVILGVGMLVKF